MGFRLRRSIKLGPGIRLNLGKKSTSLSFGTRGFHYTLSSTGRRTASIGLPGTDISYVTTHGPGKSAKNRSPATNSSPPASLPGTPDSLPKPGLFAPGSERRFFDGIQRFLRSDYAGALESFEAAISGDGKAISPQFFAGIIANQLHQYPKAIGHLEQVVSSSQELPDPLFLKYLPIGRAQLALSAAITPQITVDIPPNSFGAALVLAELYQEAGRLEDAIGLLQQLQPESGSDGRLLQLSLCELLLMDGDPEAVIELTNGITPDSDVDAACLLYRIRALKTQGLTTAAQETASTCLKKTAGRDRGLLRDLRYERALAYQALGQAARARADLERIYADDPHYRDVATRLNLSRSDHS